MTVKIRFQPGLKPIIEKHEQHDQQSHGNWATGGLDIVPDITEDMKTYFGKNLEEHLESKGYKEIMKRKENKIEGKNDNENITLEIIAEKQGFAGKPKVVSSEEMAQLEKEGWTIAYRGIANPKMYGSNLPSAKDFADEFRNGDYYAGAGVTGDGIYLTTDLSLAKTYTEQDSVAFGTGVVLKVAIPPRFTEIKSGQGKGLKRENYLDRVDFENEVEKHRNQIDKGKGASFRGADDLGVALAAKGIRGAKQIRGISLRSTPSAPSGKFENAEVFLIWDRSMLAVQDTNL